MSQFYNLGGVLRRPLNGKSRTANGLIAGFFAPM
jgi:hypothetical protein